MALAERREGLEAGQPAVETADWYVYSPDVDPTSAAFETPETPVGKPDTMVAAINKTLKGEMARNPRIVVFGEDAGYFGGVADMLITSTLSFIWRSSQWKSVVAAVNNFCGSLALVRALQMSS